MRKIFIFAISVLLFVFFNTDVQAQYWKREPGMILYGNGTNHFMGDLGGGKREAAHFLGVRDFDYQVTRPTWQIGYRYRFHELFCVRGTYTFAVLRGKDAASGFYGRKARNLSFRSPVHELGVQVEYYFLKELPPARSAITSLLGRRNFSAYIFFGGGGLYYNPKAKYEPTGKWIALRPLGTEGQYANPDGTPFTYTSYYAPFEEVQTPKPYKPIAAFISVGVGVKYNINRRWSVGMEFSNRYTSTDYLDDTHDRYFNYADFGLTPPSEYTTYFADRHVPYNAETQEVLYDLQAEPYHSGKTARGNPDYNDAYILTLIHVYYKLKKSKRNLPKFK